MVGFSPKRDRRIIPRWRHFFATLSRDELSSAKPFGHARSSMVEGDLLAQKLADWREHQTVGYAADLVGTALVLARSNEVLDAARFLLKGDSGATTLAKELADVALKRGVQSSLSTAPSLSWQRFVQLQPEYERKQIGILRRKLRQEPQDPVGWVELSLAHTIFGHRDKAKSCMAVALQLAQENRFVLRCASRLWFHLGDPEIAHDIIYRAESTPHDPWLVAVEIATAGAARRPPKLVGIGRRMVANSKFHPIHVSELASALATLDLESGKIKQARRLFVKSLNHATENSLAQFIWASQHDQSIRYGRGLPHVAGSFEAAMRVNYWNGNWQEAVDACREWLKDQPFSTYPAVFGSYLSSIVLEKHDDSEEFARRGLAANPEEFMLINNMAFALINQDKLKMAERFLASGRALRSASRQQAEHRGIVLKATRGFFEFRRGNIERARKLYLEAIENAQHAPNTNRLRALALFNYAREEIRVDGPDALRIVLRARDALNKLRDPECIVLSKRLYHIARNIR